MPVMYARCNWMLSLALDENGQPCRYISKADTKDGVLQDMSGHIQKVHNVDPADLQNNIMAVTKTQGKKTLGTRTPGTE